MKPSIPKGTRDFGTLEMFRRDYIFTTIKEVFKLYGYSPIETPAMENLSTLLGKYGDEGDKLLFKILNSGDAFSKVKEDDLKNANSLSLKVCEKGLRYDLTVPFARYVVMHQNELVFPFKRYQIQPVWRADRPQKGRYREFYQCDVDVIGTTSQLNELELIQIVDRVFEKLSLSITIKVNNRKLLMGISQVIGYPEKLIDITVAIDKIDKIGLEAVKEELKSKDISQQAIDKLEPILTLKGSNSDKFNFIKEFIKDSQEGMEGYNEIYELFKLVSLSSIKQTVELDLSLARGLNYYTGAIFEIKSNEVEIGSICGGGRYDNLTGIFGLDNMSGVGISFGADRIYDVLLSLDRFPKDTKASTTVLCANFGVKEVEALIPISQKLRASGVSVEIYPESVKLKKQFDYANKKGIPFLIICGEEEINSGVVKVKKLETGEQSDVKMDDLINFIK